MVDELVKIATNSVELEGNLCIPDNATGLVIFSHGSGSSRLSPRNNYVAQVIQQRRLGTLLFDLLTEEEDREYQRRFNIELLTERLVYATEWLEKLPECEALPLGYFGSSTGAASALKAAARLSSRIESVVSRGGRPDLAMNVLYQVKAPTLLLVGGLDYQIITFNQQAYDRLTCVKELKIIPDATHLFEEHGKLEEVAQLAADWFKQHLKS
ncbi:MAG: dienelactone hydrolase family protein [Cyclobacteriaceae bacterium]|nr:dienelactone hydrolase family protein [Cyclobacteriaceae bacterium]